MRQIAMWYAPVNNKVCMHIPKKPLSYAKMVRNKGEAIFFENKKSNKKPRKTQIKTNQTTFTMARSSVKFCFVDKCSEY
jgi:hypothetical protein